MLSVGWSVWMCVYTWAGEYDMHVTYLWRTRWCWVVENDWIVLCFCNAISWPHKRRVICARDRDLCMLKVEVAETENSQADHRALGVQALPQLPFHPKMKGRKFKSYTDTYIQRPRLMAVFKGSIWSTILSKRQRFRLSRSHCQLVNSKCDRVRLFTKLP